MHRPPSAIPAFLLWCALALATALAPASRARAAPSSGDFSLCQAATNRAEHTTFVPDQLLGAIAKVESGRADPADGSIHAWPWTINAEGVGHYYDSKQEAVAAARAFQAAGIRSIDVGCTQINLMFHPDAFASLELAFDPGTNALFAATFLTDLFHQTGSWPHAAAAYHSQTPNLGSDYQRKVLEVWAEPDDSAAGSGTPKPSRPHPAASSGMAFAAAASAPTAASSMPFSGRPLGGYGRIIRNGPITVPGAGGMGIVPGSLAAYRARPVALASMRMPPS
ncbi:transglycosylase SLT domain-containing protein [Acetobacteraceae bacterium KSS8]|uniref:Transglycosylase SLT domain-containing protein n=1 Tax=Endosaccharibacter trunci TaxID=2812733 RepID=A0ABT1W5S7_9PROT|nr:transglycosylase SLT domain-containing protein [Acetobacteraceae bacterium KSS8]